MFANCRTPPSSESRSGHNQSAPRKILYAFDPAATTPPSDSFSFIRWSNISQDADYKHAIPIYPPSLRVPWPTSLPTSLQSRHWQTAERAAQEYTETILPRNPQQATPQTRIDTMIDTAVSYAANLTPLSNPNRLHLLTKTFLLLFLHDDAVDTGDHSSTTVIPTAHKPFTTLHPAYDTLSRNLLTEDPIQGQHLLKEIASWASLSQQTHPTHKTFNNLDEYLIHGLPDFGASLILRMVEFSLPAPLTPQDKQPLQSLESLCAKHLLLTNDLYSYPKEAMAEPETVLNAVQVIQDLMNVSTSSATSILRLLIRDLEAQMDAEYTRLEQVQLPALPQLTYARAMIVAAAGNMFFSATCPRYARVVEGSRLL
ncbi:terpenoid synthase [Aspergillus heteromorphus CBS 117.55]|uniref:Terpenoid synthase n=1 Tax=Aspergillus heteromorphus CBS 117.55 TaxID=1448321 RepID=A0A317VR09_9EURO|nr:terpenoid synthase [Aspergillus heteromorphus CBS 117.55]PWY75457.1 terpenoid synthase [Aspergillus heteromorphus CBS 117.55]